MAFICFTCIQDEHLRKLLEDKRTKAQCSYCSKQGLAVEMHGVAKLIDPYLREYCCFGEMAPRFDGDDDNIEYVQEGSELIYFLQEELGMEPDPVQELIRILQENDPADPRDGGEPFYDEWQSYQRKCISSVEYIKNWQEFADGIKHARRFFDSSAKVRLERILGRPGSVIASELPVIEIGQGTKVNAIYRARRADSENEAKKFLRNPKKELIPPESQKAIAGRMNPAGITVFYGALAEETAIAEIRPFVGSLIVVGEFKATRKLSLLNLPRLWYGFSGSIFNPEYEQKADRLHFLQSFHALIAKPVLPSEESLEYLPTQAVAEYVAEILGFDGIIYASAQLGRTTDEGAVIFTELSGEELRQDNVVLFGKALDSLAFVEGAARVAKINGVKYNYLLKHFPGMDNED